MKQTRAGMLASKEGSKMTDKDKGSNIVVLATAKAQRELDEAPLEAFAPQARRIDGTRDWYITGSDGEQFYLWLATKRTPKTKRFTVTEVYPGVRKKSTHLRDVQTPEDLILEASKSSGDEMIGAVLEEIEAMLFEDIVFDEDAQE
jgi:hypothetical protein